MKNCCIENPNCEHIVWCLFFIENLFFWKKIKISIFGGISNFLKLIVFGQFWADSTALIVVESMPKARLKSLKSFNSSTVNPKITWSGSLENYHPYSLLQKVSKNPQIYYIHNSLSKNSKNHFDFLRTLGIKGINTCYLNLDGLFRNTSQNKFFINICLKDNVSLYTIMEIQL
jgi:hypothetical protein